MVRNTSRYSPMVERDCQIMQCVTRPGRAATGLPRPSPDQKPDTERREERNGHRHGTNPEEL